VLEHKTAAYQDGDKREEGREHDLENVHQRLPVRVHASSRHSLAVEAS
jgi:hypothetical protein